MYPSWCPYLALMFLLLLEWCCSTGLPTLHRTDRILIASKVVWSCGQSPTGPQFYMTNQRELGLVSVSQNNKNTGKKKVNNFFV